MATISIQLPMLHSKQLEVKRHPARFKIVVFGRQTGKTFYGTDECVHHALDGHAVGWFAPDYKKQAEVYRSMEQLLAGAIKTSNKTEMRIELITGGVIEFWSMQDADCGRSRHYHHVVIDEAGLVLELAQRWTEAIRATLLRHNGTASFLGTPKPPKSVQLKDYAFYQFFQRGLPEFVQKRDDNNEPVFGDDGKPVMVPNTWKSFHAPSSSNPMLTTAEILEMRNEPGMTKRIARQEIDAEFLGESDEALWNMELIEPYRRRVPEDVKVLGVVVFVDPGNFTSSSDADMTGIVVAAKCSDAHYYVIADLSGAYTPNKMARIVVNAANHYQAKVYFESNQGGEYVRSAIRNVSPISVTPVPSVKGKEQRAIAPLGCYEMGLVHHVDEFVDMESEMVTFNPFDTKAKSPNRMDALVGALNVLMKNGNVGLKKTFRLKGRHR